MHPSLAPVISLMRRVPLTVLLLISAAACASTAPAPAPAPATPPPNRPVATPAVIPTPDAAPAAATRMTARYAAGAQGFAVDAEATIEQAAYDSVAARRETRTTTAHVTYRIEAVAADGRQPIAGAVEFFTVVARGADGRQRAASLLTSPFEFRGALEPAGPRVTFEATTPDGAAGCGSTAPTVLAMARDVFVPLPAAIAVGDAWSESVEASECRGGVVVMSSLRHRYSVADSGEYEGSPGLRIERSTAVTIAGTGVVRGDTVRVQGTGEGRGELWVDLAGGRMLGGVTETRAELSVQSGVAVPQRFVQTNRRRIVPR